FTSLSQNKMRPFEELINKTDPGWAFVKEWIDSAKNKVEILPVDAAKAKDALYKIQVTTRSPMGAIVYMTGGLLIDNGWIRILGSGSSKLNRSLPDWNKGKTLKDSVETSGFLLIADDVIGGFFILNGGIFGEDLGKVYYFSPDNLEFEALHLTYSDFLLFCFNNDLDKFYAGYRWKGWKEEVSNLAADKVYNFVPTLWTKEGKDFDKNSRKAIPVEEQFNVNIYFRKQLGIDK
ncbi:MAG: DUF2625 domain-containing protein, partial [Ferruginibacter sp.]